MKKEWVLITGGLSGIGFETAKLLLSNYNLVVQYNVSKDPFLKKLSSQCDSKMVFIKADFSSQIKILQFVKRVRKLKLKFSHILHFAGSHEKFFETSLKAEPDVYKKVFNINSYAPIYITNNLIDRIINSHYSSVLFVSTIYLRSSGSLRNLLYTTSKATLLPAAKIFAKEFYPIRFNVITPGYVDTKFFRYGKTQTQIETSANKNKVKKLLNPQDIARSCLSILEDDTKNNCEIFVD